MATELTEEHGTALGRVNPCLTTVSVCRTNTVVLLGWELERLESPPSVGWLYAPGGTSSSMRDLPHHVLDETKCPLHKVCYHPHAPN